MESEYNNVVVVDEADNIIGAENMMVAIDKGLIRRAARIFVFNESGKLLIQQRSKHVLKPLKLDQSAAGHVDEGETYEEAAYRELQEELGLSNYRLTLVETSFRTRDFFNAIYKLTIPDNTLINFDPEELETIFWYEVDTLNQEIDNTPDKFTESFKELWEKLGSQIIAA